MSFLLTTKGKFHIALKNGNDNFGLLLQGTPNHLAYKQSQAPIYGNRFASGDRSYADFSFWWFWSQTDWSGGIKTDEKWEDDAKFHSSEGVSVTEKVGSVILNKKLNASPASVATSVLFYDYGEINGADLYVLVGRNVTDNTGIVINAVTGAIFWSNGGTLVTDIVNCAESFDITGLLYIGCNTVTGGGGASTLKYSNGSAFLDVPQTGTTITSPIHAIVAVPSGDFLYIFTDAGVYKFIRGSGAVSAIAGGLYPNGAGISMCSFNKVGATSCPGKGAWRIGTKIYFTVKEPNESLSQLWHIETTDGTYVHDYTFGVGLCPRRLIARDSNLYLFAPNTQTGRVEIWKYNGITMSMIFEIGRLGETSVLVANPVKDSNNIYFTIDDGSSDYQIWQLDVNDILSNGVTPPSGFTTSINMLANSHGGRLTVAKNGAVGVNAISSSVGNPNDSRQSTGWLKTSIFDASIPSIEKLYYSAIIGFDALITGQSIQVEYSLDGGTFVSLGTYSYNVNQPTISSKTFLFGTNIISKTIQLRFTLTGAGTNATTPSLNSFSVQFIPMPKYTKSWTMNLACSNEIKTLDGRLSTKTGRELKALLESAWWSKSILDFQDLDYAETTLSDNPLAYNSTTINVASTVDFPEQGRIKIDDEEIFYTGKTPTSFTGCARGSRLTLNVSHIYGSYVHNAYKVIVTELQTDVPIALEDKELEFIVGIGLRET